MKQLAIIGPTASGKSDLAISVAQKIDAYILSIDSLSIYKKIDIVAAKPSPDELALVQHFGIDTLYPDEHFSAQVLIKLYEEVVQSCLKDAKNLVIVGGTSFYLKSLTEGLSELPKVDEKTKADVKEQMQNQQEVYEFLRKIDAEHMSNIDKNDSYRTEKALLIYESTKQIPSKWFASHPPKPLIENLPIFNIDVSREVLKERINLRTAKMIEMGVIDEVASLEQEFGRAIHPMGAIGIVEVLEYLDAKVSLEEMQKNIAIHTAQLAKRQQTFNKTQFQNIYSAPLQDLEGAILKECFSG